MLDNTNNSPNQEEQQIDKICEQICEVLNGTQNVSALRRKSSLSPKLEKLILLGSAIVSQRERDVVVRCVFECLKSGATREDVADVLRQANLMSEVPGEVYSRIVDEAIDDFKSQD